MLSSVIRAYLPEIEQYYIAPIGSGLIHHTWKVEANGGSGYILQEVNTGVFTDPDAIAHNLSVIGRYLAREAPGYRFVAPLKTINGDVFCREDGMLYRM